VSAILDKADKGDKIPTDDYSVGLRGSSAATNGADITIGSREELYMERNALLHVLGWIHLLERIEMQSVMWALPSQYDA